MHHKKRTDSALETPCVYGTQAGSRKDTARLSTMTRCRERSHSATAGAAQVGGLRIADADRQ